MELKIHPTKTVRILWIAIAILALLHLIACIPFFFMGRSFPLGPLSMDGEQNIPTLFSTALLWCCSLIAGCIAWAGRSEKWQVMLPWLGLALAFLGMGVDEFMELHERFTEPIRNALNTSGPLSYAWVIPYAVLALLFALVYMRFFLKLPADTRKYIMIAAILYVGGCIGCEMVAGAWIEQHGRSTFYYLLAMVEEVLEMSGVTCFIYAFLNHIDKHVPNFSMRITSS